MKAIHASAVFALSLLASCHQLTSVQEPPYTAATNQQQISKVLARPKASEQECFFIHAGEGDTYKDGIKVPITGTFKEYLLKMNEQDLLPSFSFQYATLADPWLYTIQIGEKYYAWSGLNHIKIVGKSQGMDKCYSVPFLAIRGTNLQGTPAAVFKEFEEYGTDKKSPQSLITLKDSYKELNQYLNSIYSPYTVE